MLALGAANLVGVVLFAAVYTAGGARYLSQGGFVACLLLLFALVTALWVRTESRHAPLGFVRRLGRAAAALALVAVGVPVSVLMPLFWLETALPPEAGFSRVLGPSHGPAPHRTGPGGAGEPRGRPRPGSPRGRAAPEPFTRGLTGSLAWSGPSSCTACET